MKKITLLLTYIFGALFTFSLAIFVGLAYLITLPYLLVRGKKER